MYANTYRGSGLGQFIGRDPWLVLGALGQEDEQQTAMPRADMNAIWKRRMVVAGYTAGGIALAGTATTAALAVKGRSGWAVGIGIVSSLAALTAVGVSMFSKAQIKAA